jgi:hypothetical protein
MIRYRMGDILRSMMYNHSQLTAGRHSREICPVSRHGSGNPLL